MIYDSMIVYIIMYSSSSSSSSITISTTAFFVAILMYMWLFFDAKMIKTLHFEVIILNLNSINMENNSMNSLNINIDLDNKIGIDNDSSLGLLKRPTEGNFSSPLPIKSGIQDLTSSDDQFRNSSGRFRLKILNITFKTYLLNF